jgi:hypothetical protein
LSPDIRQHRGPHPADQKLFSNEYLPHLRSGVTELSWLLTHGYAPKAAVKLVGDKHRLTERQRFAVARAACSDASLIRRQSTLALTADLKDAQVIIDGFNLIITVEAALSGGVLLICRDECIRDLSSVHGSYRAVSETDAAMVLIGEELQRLQVKTVEWLLDQPISNSGRLAKRMRELAAARGWPWTVELLFNPDERINSSEKVAITSDGVVLDRVNRWVNFKEYLVKEQLRESWIVQLNK